MPQEEENKKEKKKYNVDLLPILIIPGFMSSGLEIVESERRPGWNGQRLWINLTSLGFEAMHFGKSVGHHESILQRQQQQPGDADGPGNNASSPTASVKQHIDYKSDWLTHMSLQRDMVNERKGIKVRAVPGLRGVDYLTPGTLTNHVSYVFGPVIAALTRAGYTEGVNLDAASYDWRLPPTEMENRDGYFTNAMSTVEKLYDANEQTPVVLLCHSLGCKVGHYFLNFCKQRKGREWIDKYVHTYMPVGGPHLGAPKAIRSVIVGDKMSLDTFLDDEEALMLGRSLGSGPWLFPGKLPVGAVSCSFARPQASLAVKVGSGSGQLIPVARMLQNRRAMAKSKYFKLALVYQGTTVVTEYHAESGGLVQFPETFVFATPEHAVGAARIHGGPDFQVLLLEPGAQVAKKEKEFNCCRCLLCWCLCCPCKVLCLPFRLAYCIVSEAVILSAEAVTRAIGGSTILAASHPVKLADHISPDSPTATIDFQLTYGESNFWNMYRVKYETLRLEFEWKPPPSSPSSSQSGSIQRPFVGVVDPGTKDLTIVPDKEDCKGRCDMLEREGCNYVLTTMRDVYETDPLDPRGYSSSEAPPVNRVKAIYGVNLHTEVAAVYRRKPGRIYTPTSNVYELDKKAKLSQDPADLNGYQISGGIVEETKYTNQLPVGRATSGDGTVPYFSLWHVHTWKDQCRFVDVTEIDRAEHREILADERFHNTVIDYVTVNKNNKT